MRVDMREYCRLALENCDDDPEAAIVWLLERSADDDALRAILLSRGARYYVQDWFHGQRRSAMSMAIGRSMSMDEDEAGERIASRLARKEFWESYTLYGMQPIKTATKQELLKSANMRGRVSRAHAMAAKFESAVAVRVPEDKRVYEVMTSADVEKIATSTEGVTWPLAA